MAPAPAGPPGYVDVVVLTGEPSYIRVLTYDDGTIRFEHWCVVGGARHTVAPLLAHHNVTCRKPLTLHPSVQCDDCGLHGTVVDGTWAPV